MDILQPEAQGAAGSFVAPKIEEKPPFTVSMQEIIVACISYILAWILCGYDNERIVIPLFTVGLVALGEFLYRERPRAWESWVWMGCTLAAAAAIMLDRYKVWSANWQGMLVFVVFYQFSLVWYLLSRSGTLLGGESGRLLPLDALSGFLAVPLQNFFLRIRTLIYAFSRVFQRKAGKTRERPEKGAALWTLGIILAAFLLMRMALHLLRSADSGFSAMVGSFTELFRLEWDWELKIKLIRFLFSLPLGCWVYALMGGSLRRDRAKLQEKALRIEQRASAMRRVSARVWQILLVLFCTLYAVFFVVQGSYLFGAFTRTLPEGFVVAEYARQGFFELCKVMVVNFTLFYLAWRTSKGGAMTRIMLLVLLAESLLLAVVAFSKLALYIDCFGFTPKRLQSLWLVCVLAFGCGCAIVHLITGKKVFRTWMFFSAISLAVLSFY